MTSKLEKDFFSLLTGEEANDACRDISDAACREEPGSFSRHAIALSTSKIGDGLVDPKLVLAWLLSTLGAPAAFIGLLVPIREAGALLPQLFTAGALRRLEKRKWAWAMAAIAQGLSALAIGMAALTLEATAAGIAILLALAALAVSRSVASVTYKDVLGKTVAKSRRGTVTGAANTVGAAAVLAFGALLASGQFDRLGIVTAGLFLAGALWISGGLAFLTLREAPGETENGDNLMTLAVSNLALLKSDAQLRRFILTRGLLISTALAPPFMISLASRRTGEELQQAFGGLGLLVIASAAAGLISSYVWGRLADTSSRKVLILTSLAAALTLLATLALDAAGFLGSVWALPLMIFGLMIAYQGVRLGRSTHLVDMASEDNRAAYTALSNTLIGLLLLLGSGFSLLAGLAGEPAVLLVFSLMSLAAMAAALGLEEVQARD